MNTFLHSHTEYIRPSRTIETVHMSNDSRIKSFDIYNYEGYSFRLFEDILALILFFETGEEAATHFDSEEELDCFLETVSL